MQVDHWSTLTQGQARNSVRIESQQTFNKGLFILVRKLHIEMSVEFASTDLSDWWAIRMWNKLRGGMGLGLGV